MAAHFADRLTEQIKAKRAPVCVGLDPVLSRLPAPVLAEAGIDPKRDDQHEPGAAADALLSFGKGVIDNTADLVPAIKINIAFFERFHLAGLRVYEQLIQHARNRNLLVIGDVKRADIGHTSGHYAHAHLGPDDADAITINPYFGIDGVAPFIDAARHTGRGLFVLVQTSNASAETVQGAKLANGETVCQHIARLVDGWSGGPGLVGESDLSLVGAVVSPRDLPSTEKIRDLMPRSIFLVPGFGAQGRTAQEVARCFKPDGTGAIVSASRSVIFAHEDENARRRFGDDWTACVKDACTTFVAAVRDVAPTA